MKIHVLQREQFLPVSPDEAWAFFSDARNLDDITPPELQFRIVPRDLAPIHEGQIIWYRIRLFPGVWTTWVTEITHVRERRWFVDEQRFGPYKLWHHRHVFEEVPGGVKMTDTVHYALPFSPLSEPFHGLLVGRKVARIFDHRRRILAERFGA